MKLGVKILPLKSGPLRSGHLHDEPTVTPIRRFIVPVKDGHTFEHVWKEVEQRYKSNYAEGLKGYV